MSMSDPVSIRIIRTDEFDAGTAQTAGSQRLAAVTRSHGIATGLWGGLFSIAPGARIDIHHHGAQETIAFVLEGVSHLRWGEHGEFSGMARPGDFLHIPPWLLHMEINPSVDTPVRWVVIRSTPEPIVVNLPTDTWDPAGSDPALPLGRKRGP
jgi:uncharacterized RmlC-like cupin family protein